MTTCRSDYRWIWLLAALLVAVAYPVGHRATGADESPVGRIVSEIVPVNNRVHPPEQILRLLHTKVGKAYDETVVQEDLRRLYATKWFVPGGVQFHTRPDAAGKVTVFVYVTELTSIVQEIRFNGAQHLSDDKLRSLSGIRKGEPMSPLANELGRTAIQHEYQDDGRYYATVTLVEGNKPTDTRVVYDIVEGPLVKVAGIEFRGNTNAQSGRLRAQLTTSREYLGFISGKFHRQSIDADLKKLYDYYHGLGYLGVKIGYDIVPSADSSHVTIVYLIDEGIQYKVGERRLEGNATYPAETLEARLQLQPNDRYDQWTVTKDKKRLEDFYGYRGYKVGVNEQIYEVPDQPGVVQVKYVVQGDKGEQDRVGTIRIEGNTITKDRVIQNQLDFYPGQILQYPKLEEARVRLARLGIFDTNNPPSVERVVDPNDPDNPFKDVVVRVNETRTGQFMIGGGVNSNAGVSGSVVINESNFDLFRLPTSWDDFLNGRAFRGAGQELRLEAVPGTQFQRYSTTFREPLLFDTQFGFTDSLYYFQRSYVEYFENRIGDRITLDRRLDPIWKASVSFRAEAVEAKNIPDYAGPGLTDFAGWHSLFGVRVGLNRDSRDSILYPTTGSVFDIGVEQEFGSYTFPVATASYTKLFSSEYLQREDGSGKHVLAFRSQVSVEGTNAPMYEKFYAGGFGSLRGFTFRGVGPSQNDLMVGGTFSFLNTIEYQIPILPNDKLFFVTFLDHGTVEQSVEIKNYRVSAGFGFRIAVPALGPMPIALDFAFPIVKASTDDTQVFSFYVGMFGGR